MGAKDSKIVFSGETLQISTTPYSTFGNFFVSADSTKATTLIRVINPLNDTFAGYLTAPFFQISPTISSSLVASSITNVDSATFASLFDTTITFFQATLNIYAPYITETNDYQIILSFLPTTTSQDPIELPDVLLQQNFTFTGTESVKTVPFVFAYYDSNQQCLTYRITNISIALSWSPNQTADLLASGSVQEVVTITYTNGRNIYPFFNATNPQNLSNCLGTLDFVLPGGSSVYYSTTSNTVTSPCSSVVRG
jgi:hypothetical protein